NDTHALLQVFIGFLYASVVASSLEVIAVAIRGIEWRVLSRTYLQQRFVIDQLALGLLLLFTVVQYYLVIERLQRSVRYDQKRFLFDGLVVACLFMATRWLLPSGPGVVLDLAGVPLVAESGSKVLSVVTVWINLIVVYAVAAGRLVLIETSDV